MSKSANNSKATQIAFQEHALGDVMTYFIRGFKAPDGYTVVKSEWFLDHAKGMVILKLFVEGEQSKILTLQ